MRVSALLVVVLLGAAATHAKRVSGELQPVPAAADMRFAQQHNRVGSEAPDWWHYVAPWWSPPEHDKTKEVPDFVEEPAYEHFKEPPENTMSVYVPYGRDAMSSFVEVDTRLSQSPQMARRNMAMEAAGAFAPQMPGMAMESPYGANPQRPLYAGLDTGFGPMPTAGMRYPMPRFAQKQTQTQAQGQQQQAQVQQTAAAGAAAGAPPTMPAFPAVPQFDDAANEFALPSALQMSPYEAMLKRALHPELMQQQMQQPYGAPMPPPPGSVQAMQMEADSKAAEAQEDARWATLADQEFGTHARVAASGGQVPRIWRTDRESSGDLAEEKDFDLEQADVPSDAELEADAQDAQEMMAFRQTRGSGDAASEVEHHRHEGMVAEAQRLRAASAAQFDDEQQDAEAEEEHAPLNAPFSAYRFQQLGDDSAAESDAEMDAELDAELDEEEAAEHHTSAASHADADSETEEVEEEEVDAGAADESEAESEEQFEREADALEEANDRRM